MMVTLWSATPCLLCAYRIRVLMTASVRVNKRSMRTTGMLLGGLQYGQCPECGEPCRAASLAPRSPYVLDAESAEKVREYRLKRWGIEERGAVTVERASCALHPPRTARKG